MGHDLTDARRLRAVGCREAAPAPVARYDVAIIGGALSGAATATMLLRKNPALRVLIIERSPGVRAAGGGIHD